MIDKCADINAEDNHGQNPLHIASIIGKAECAKIFIEEGKPDVNAKDEDGMMPLHKASRYRHADCAKILIAKAAKLNVKTNSALYTAIAA